MNMCSKCGRPTYQHKDGDPIDHTECLDELARDLTLLEERVKVIEDKFLDMKQSINGWGWPIEVEK
jgi:hypothetical protein